MLVSLGHDESSLMIPSLLIALLLAQGGTPEIFAEAGGWSIARQGHACLMTREFGDAGNSIFAVSVDPQDRTLPLTLLVGNGDWARSIASRAIRK